MTTDADDVELEECLHQFQKLLTRKAPGARQARTKATADLVDAGLVPQLVQLLHRQDNPGLQWEALRALTFIALPNAPCLIQAGAVPVLVQLTNDVSKDLQEQAAWALGNIAESGVPCRDQVLEAGGLDALLRLAGTFTVHSREATIQNTAWAVANLCYGKPAPATHVVIPALPFLLQCITYGASDSEIVNAACTALGHLTIDADADKVEAVLHAGVCPHIIKLLGTHGPSQVLAVKIVGSIVSGSEVHTQRVLDLHVLPVLLALLDSPDKALVKDVCWTLSNIAAGAADQIQEAIDANVFPRLISLLHPQMDLAIQKEAAWAVCNATAGTPAQIAFLLKQGLVPQLCRVIQTRGDSRLLDLTLEALENILLKVAPGGCRSSVLLTCFTCGAVARLITLKLHRNQSVYQRALRLLRKHFEDLTPEEVRWECRRACVLTLVGSGCWPRAMASNAPRPPLPAPEELDTPEKRHAYQLRRIFGDPGLQRVIVNFL